MFAWVAGLFKKRPALPRVLFTSDLHFSHRNILDYCARPWKDKEAMNKGLVKLWNKQVRPQDTVYILGDFSLSPKVAFKYAPMLNGKKHLVLGNHDAPFEFDRRNKASKAREKYLEHFESVEMEARLTLKDGTNVLLKHFPYSLEYDQRYRQHRPEDKGGWLLHGHTHCKYLKSGKQIDVGVDNNFRLLTEDDIIALMKDERDFIPTRLTGKVQKKRDNMKGEDHGEY